ncbi:MAG: hypothetical protein OS130_02520 [Thermodesulfobacteriota bacterium]|jgi:hypothetical protein|nr:MAG: hypothetical protein OS130_02520 [Thermodesulfobacteriota bacterium]
MNAYALNLAVLEGHGNVEKNAFELSYGLFHGTAFGIALDLFLTAAHVFKDAQGDGEVALARLTPGHFHAQTVRDFEIFDDIDLALLNCNNLSAEILPFNFTPLNFLVDVFTMGYPFGFEPPVYHLRAFKGHIVTRRGLTSLPGVPLGYELSFVPPPGLSGAPLLTLLPDGSPVIAGMVLQHHIAEYRKRRMELGIALDIGEILTLESRIVGGNIAERLFNRKRLVRK